MALYAFLVREREVDFIGVSATSRSNKFETFSSDSEINCLRLKEKIILEKIEETFDREGR